MGGESITVYRRKNMTSGQANEFKPRLTYKAS